jgi:hypothetical protein
MLRQGKPVFEAALSGVSIGRIWQLGKSSTSQAGCPLRVRSGKRKLRSSCQRKASRYRYHAELTVGASPLTYIRLPPSLSHSSYTHTTERPIKNFFSCVSIFQLLSLFSVIQITLELKKIFIMIKKKFFLRSEHLPDYVTHRLLTSPDAQQSNSIGFSILLPDVLFD